jgi:hypothetical protein
MATGYAATRTFAETWDGSAWTLVPTAGDGQVLWGVSCVSTTFCLAVGRSTVYRWDGSGWAVQADLTPPGADSVSLNAITCTSPTNCVVVADAGRPLVEHFDGTAWHDDSAPNPTPDGYSQLTGVACAAADRCVAVGSSYPDGALAESWNGTAWTITSRPVAADALSSVACTSTSCVAIGVSYGDGPAVQAAEIWDGDTWTAHPPVRPATGTDLVLNAISCAGAGCTAVGYTSDAGALQPAVQRWDGSQWTAQPTVPIATDGYLAGVSCVSSTSCIAVGNVFEPSASDGQLTLVEAWDGHSWTTQNSVSPASELDSDLLDISCASATNCTAVGTTTVNVDADLEVLTPLAESWDGHGWTQRPVQSPAGSISSYLNGVSCPGTNACVAAGASQDAAGDWHTLVERWNGATWSVVETPDPAGHQGMYLVGVSCISATWCAAVGGYQDSSGRYRSLTEIWNGLTWLTTSTTDVAAAAGSELIGVSCTTVAACVAVGDYIDGSDNVFAAAQTWNGRGWVATEVANPSGTDYASFASVSCTSATSCTAVGRYHDVWGGRVPLAEAMNGKRWSVQSVPNPTGSDGYELWGVSCATAARCTAVGEQLVSGGGFRAVVSQPVALGLSRNRWSLQQMPAFAKQDLSLSEVDCTSASVCTAVGFYSLGYPSYRDVTLVMRSS